MTYFLMISLMIIFILTMKHPISLGLSLLFQTINISLIIGFMNYNYWFSYILFLIMIGGLLILFIYMTSIASNEKFKYSPLLLMSLFMSLIMLMMMTYMIDNFTITTNMMNLDMINNNLNLYFNYNMNKYINFPNNIIYMMTIMYLLLTLIIIVKISSTKKGSLRQMNQIN